MDMQTLRVLTDLLPLLENTSFGTYLQTESEAIILYNLSTPTNFSVLLVFFSI